MSQVVNSSPVSIRAQFPTFPRTDRIVSVDMLRGLVMVVMAIDHARDYLTNVPFEPESIAHTWPALFFARWITHFCAPTFIFLAGVGALLSSTRGKSRRELAGSC